MSIEVVGLESLKELYEDDVDFVESWRACKQPWSGDRTPYLDYFIHEGLLF
jgi:hypothetical protein